MAPIAKHFSLLFLFLSLLSSHLGHARELRSFSKFTNRPTTTTANAKETIEVTNKEQEPSFLPDTKTGYGLYGHESGQLPPTTAASAKTTTDAPSTNNYPYSKEVYVTDPQGMSDTRFMGRGFTTTATTTDNHPYKEAYVTYPQGYTNNNKNNNNNYYNGASNNYNSEKQGSSDTSFIDGRYSTTGNAAAASSANNYYNRANNYYNNQKQGMSDTRFLENGKYYYNVPRENNYGNYVYENSRGVNYNNRGYYGNNGNSYVEGSRNQEQFQENEEEYVP